jgi:ABC-type antimicrobial peptide transport system permease subunit
MSIRLSNIVTYILAPENFSTKPFEEKLDVLKKKHSEDQYDEKEFLVVQPLLEIHNDEKFGARTGSYVTSKSTIGIVAIIGVFILIIACINFINMATAQAIKRSKEVGVRKVLGAVRPRLIRQFLGESSLITLVAIVFSIILSEIFLSKLNEFLGNGVELGIYSEPFSLLFLILIFIVVSLFTGLYPAIVLSRYKPIEALKNKMNSHKKRKVSLRGSLVILQFIISIVLIICTLIISMQVNYLQNKELGFTKKSIIVIDLPDNKQSVLDVLSNKLSKKPEVLEFTYALGAPSYTSNFLTEFSYGDLEEEYETELKPVDDNYLKTFDLQLIAGEWLPPNNKGVLNTSNNLLSEVEDWANKKDSLVKYVVNRALIKRAGIESPADAIEKFISVSDNKGKIIGVVEDFHSQPLRNKINPLVFSYFKTFWNSANIKIKTKNIASTIEDMKEIWEEVYPDFLFDYEFLDDVLREYYERETRTFGIIRFFSAIAILIACLGLFGMVSFITIQRTKEIGIRKVMGASILKIVILLSNEFLKLAVIAFVIASPIAYYFMNEWLQDFAYRIGFLIWIWVFILTFFITIIIALVTVGFQTLKTATANPVSSLRYE